MNEDTERLQKLFERLEYDGYGYWLPDFCVKVGEDSPSFQEFCEEIDRLKCK